MTQLDLFGELPFPVEARSCGNCVHLNADKLDPLVIGSCTPKGWRGPLDKPCDQWFALDQLIAACAPKRRAA